MKEKTCDPWHEENLLTKIAEEIFHLKLEITMLQVDLHSLEYMEAELKLLNPLTTWFMKAKKLGKFKPNN